jgi:hypothetical protein
MQPLQNSLAELLNLLKFLQLDFSAYAGVQGALSADQVWLLCFSSICAPF